MKRIRLDEPGCGLYLVTDRKKAKGGLLRVVEEALDSGLKWLQLREKDLDGGELLNLAEEIRSLTNRYGAGLIINDRVDVALLVDADGVHLGQKSFSPGDVRPLLGEERLVGVSTHSLGEALKAEVEGADFITLGPVYFTPSKAGYGEPVGISTLRLVKENLKIPVFAIGGIRADRIEEIKSTGARGAALIREVMESSDAGRTVKRLLKNLENQTPPQDKKRSMR